MGAEQLVRVHGEVQARVGYVLRSWIRAMFRAWRHREVRLYWLLEPLQVLEGLHFVVRYTHPRQAFRVNLSRSFLLGSVRSMPFLGVQWVAFQAPACLAHEQKVRRLLYSLGLCLRFFVERAFSEGLMPKALIFLSKRGSSPRLDFRPHLNEYLAFLGRVARGLCLGARSPLRIWWFVGQGVGNLKFRVQNRRGRVLRSFTLAALRTPPDIRSQVIVGLLLRSLREVVVIQGRWSWAIQCKKKSKQDAFH